MSQQMYFVCCQEAVAYVNGGYSPGIESDKTIRWIMSTNINLAILKPCLRNLTYHGQR